MEWRIRDLEAERRMLRRGGGDGDADALAGLEVRGFGGCDAIVLIICGCADSLPALKARG